MCMFYLKLLYRIPVVLFKFIISFSLTLIGIPILAVLLLFVPRNKEQLPSLFRWFDNHEAHLRPELPPWDVDGLSGPSYYRETLKDPTGWWARFNWLALRNPTNYFNYKILGFQVKDKLTPIYQHGSPNIGDQLDRPKGIYLSEVMNGDGKVYWSIYLVLPLPYVKNRVFRLRAGHKLDNPQLKKHNKWTQHVLAITPFKKSR